MATPFEILEKTLKIKPVKSHQIIYDSPTETLEPVYFWLLNFTNTVFGAEIEKIVDNFASSPGSGHFSEQSQKKTILQEQVMKTLGAINQVIRTIVNIVYDLKDFEIRLAHYEAAKSEDKGKKEQGMLALKQIWMDNVDIKRGQGSINAMTQGGLQFTTLRDAFMVAKTTKDIDKLDLNDRVKRILKPRMAEFEQWKKLSEQELQKRFNIEKNYLKSQVNTLKLYTRWIKPYLKAAAQLEMMDQDSPELVTVFNTLVLQLTLLAKRKVDVEDEILNANLPKGMKLPKRDYFAVALIDFKFVGIPTKPAGQHYAFGGRVTINFKGYALNSDQLEALHQELGKSDFSEVMKLIEGSTTESLDELQKDIDYFIGEGEKEEKEKPKNTGPFQALFSGFFKKKEDTKNKKIDIKKIKKDSYSESLVRGVASSQAEAGCFALFDVYKKAHGMPSHTSPYE